MTTLTRSRGADLRGRRKARLRQSVQSEALHLFAIQGYEATTVEQIAEAADISPSTFFRHFPTKEDVVLTDDYDPVLTILIEQRPADESPIEALRRSVPGWIAYLLSVDEGESLARFKLILSAPALRGRMWDAQLEQARVLAEVLARRAGKDPQDFTVQVAASACLSVMLTAVAAWVNSDGAADLAGLIDTGLEALEGGFGAWRSARASNRRDS